jgi:phytoene desaturase
MNKKAIVIGSGVGGLATALRLRKKNFEVTVFEAQSKAGGKATRISQDGFTWGFGPSLLTLPHLIDELFIHCGKNPKDYYEYVRLDPICKYFFEDGKQLHAHANNELFAKEIEAVTSEPKQNINNHLKDVFRNYELTKDLFLHSSVHKLKTYTQPQAFKAMMNVHRLGIFTTMNESLEKKFKTPHAVQLFNRYATYNGSDPYKCPATMNVIAAPEYAQGGFMLKNGMPQLSEAMFQLACEMGIQFQFNSRVEKIEVTQNKATGVWSNGTFYPADLVASNMDVQFTYKQLLPNQKHPENILSQPRSTSAVIFYWGMKKTFPQLEAHNILFSKNYREEFRHKGELKTIYEDPTIYIFISSKVNKNHAPEGGENWFTLINAPYNNGQNWNDLLQKSKRIMIEKINRLIGENIEPFIVTEHINTPVTIEEKTLSYLGSLYGNSSDTAFSAFLRHPNFSRTIKNLFFCGGSVHPGGGVPLCLLSAKLIDELVD